MNIATYTTSVVLSIAADPNFWNKRCVNWYNCGRTETDLIIQDMYYASPSEANRDGVEFGMHICRTCSKIPLWRGANVIADRNVPELPPKKIRLRIAPDMFNNVGRRCDNLSDPIPGRNWVIRTFLTDEEFNRYYLVQNWVTGEQRIELVWSLTSMY